MAHTLVLSVTVSISPFAEPLHVGSEEAVVGAVVPVPPLPSHSGDESTSALSVAVEFAIT